METMTQADVLVNSIMEYVPQVTFVVEQIGQAVNIAKAQYTEEELIETLERTVEVAKFAKEVSNSEAFYKYHLVVISLLVNITDESLLAKFETQSNSVINGIKALKVDESIIVKKGFVKANVLHLAKLYHENQDLFAMYMIMMTRDFNKAVQMKIEERMLKTALIEQTIRMNKFEYLAPVKAITDKLFTIINKVAL